MAMRRLRFRVRTFMIVVALTAAGFGAYFEAVHLARLRSEYRYWAGSHARAITLCRKSAAIVQEGQNARRKAILEFDQYANEQPQWRDIMVQVRAGMVKDAAEDAEFDSRVIAEYGKLAQYHERLSKKYTRLSKYPWLAATPDPPEPPQPLFMQLNRSRELRDRSERDRGGRQLADEN